MQTRKLLEVDYHYDSDTGIVEIGEVDFGVCGTLPDFIKQFGYKGMQDILATLGHLAWEVKQEFYKQNKPETEKSA